jgi:hypothetical protein
MCLAVRDRLRKRMGFKPLECDVRPPPGKPPAAAGELFVAVHEAGLVNDAVDSRDDRVSVSVTLTRRVPVSPDDREAEEIIHRLVVGLEVVADQVASIIHGDLKGTGGADVADNYAIMTGANGLMTGVLPVGTTFYGYCEPLRLLSIMRTEERGPEWFSGDPKEGGAAGRSVTVNFGKARRIQSLFLQS